MQWQEMILFSCHGLVSSYSNRNLDGTGRKSVLKASYWHSHLPSAEGFYPQNLACTPKNDEVPYMLLYIEGTKIRNKTKCTPNFKMQWERCNILQASGPIHDFYNMSDH